MKYIIILIYLLTFNLAFAEQKVKAPDKQKLAPQKQNNLKQLLNPFALTEIEEKQIVPAYRKRLLTSTDVKKIELRIKKLQQDAQNIYKANALKEPSKGLKKEVSSPPVFLKYKKISYIKGQRKIRLSNVEDESLNFHSDYANKVDIEKNVDFLWFDLSHEDPRFLRSIISDKLTLKDKFIKSPKGQKVTKFLKNLAKNKKVTKDELKTLHNELELAYEFDDKKGTLDILFDLNVNHQLQVKIIVKLEEYTQLLHHRLLYPGADKQLETLLPLLNTHKIKNLYLKLQIKHDIHQIAEALEGKDGKTLMAQYTAYKQVKAQDWQQRYPALTIEQALAYKQAVINFVEYKQPLIMQINLSQSERVATLMSFILLAAKNPQAMSLLVKTLNLSITN